MGRGSHSSGSSILYGDALRNRPALHGEEIEDRFLTLLGKGISHEQEVADFLWQHELPPGSASAGLTTWAHRIADDLRPLGITKEGALNPTWVREAQVVLARAGHRFEGDQAMTIAQDLAFALIRADLKNGLSRSYLEDRLQVVMKSPLFEPRTHLVAYMKILNSTGNEAVHYYSAHTPGQFACRRANVKGKAFYCRISDGSQRVTCKSCLKLRQSNPARIDTQTENISRQIDRLIKQTNLASAAGNNLLERLRSGPNQISAPCTANEFADQYRKAIWQSISNRIVKELDKAGISLGPAQYQELSEYWNPSKTEVPRALKSADKLENRKCTL